MSHATSQRPRRAARLLAAVTALPLLGSLLVTAAVAPGSALASHTGAPASVTIAGSLQSEAGCAGDWDPACAATHLTFNAEDAVWQGSWPFPAGSYEYKAALNDAWTENYGQNATENGPNLPLNLGAATPVKFYYSHATHWVTDNVTSAIAVAPGSFQSEMGCAGDWDPSCLRSWLQDPDGDGIHVFETDDLPAGSYETKVAINESWDLNYGAGGAVNGANIAFSVPVDNAPVTFSYDGASHVLSIEVGNGGTPNDVQWDGLGHDSRDLLYRTPGGAVPAGTPVTIRFRTLHDDVTSVKLRVFDLNAGTQKLLSMSVAAAGVDCYDAALDDETCDFWAVTLPNASPNNLWYRFVVTDGTDIDYYADNTPALDGGIGAASEDAVDTSWALMVHEPDFTSPSWARDAVIYQIFPDRFRNGRRDNDPKTGDVRYDDPVLKLPWGALPEGFCRNYADGNVACPWRFDATPPPTSPTVEQPRGRDYMGGDLKGVDQQLEYLDSIGITAIYFNPVFDAGSNHSYDTQDYTRIDPYFGSKKDWDNLVKHADELGIRLILDGVFNHLSSDSLFFDRYHHYSTVGACESVSSPYRAWFVFHDVAPGTGTCAGSGGANSATYDGWFGFDSIPVLNKSNAQVQAYFLTNPDSIAARWLAAGASAWRMDVSGDASFPAGYWETFREEVEAADPDALTISETWQKDSTLLRMIRGDRLDTTMNYRTRDAVLGLLAPGSFDSKGFADSGSPIDPSEFAARLASVREDYPDAAYYALMNLLDSHDTERILWTLTPGAETTAEKELDAGNLEEGKRRLRLATLVQYGVPGAPTVYYGDEVGVTGDDDPDDRRTYPWADLGGSPDTALRSHYAALAALRASTPALTDGDFRILATNDADGTVAFGRRTDAGAAIVAINRSGEGQTLTIPVDGFAPDGTSFSLGIGVGLASGGPWVAAGGEISITLPALGGAIVRTGSVDLAPPAAPDDLFVTVEGDAVVGLDWGAVAGATGYNVYRSPLTGGGFVRLNGAPLAATDYEDADVTNGAGYFYVVTALDAAGNESGWSNEVSALPHLTIGWANLQWPPSMTHVISTTDRTDTAYGQVWIDGVTNQPGATPGLRAQLGFGPDGSSPDGNAAWTWVDAAFNTDAGNNDEYQATMLPEQVGTFEYVYRYSTTNGNDWLYADLNGPFTGTPPNPGALTVTASADTTAPAIPTGLEVSGSSPSTIELDWDDVVDGSLHGYEVARADVAGGPYSVVALVTASDFVDTSVEEGEDYAYVVRAVDTSFNRSSYSGEVIGSAEARTVNLTFSVTVPAATDATGRLVYIAGFIDRLDGGHPQWDPGGTSLTRVDATHWTITFTGKEGVQLEYKYTLGDWEHVEKDGACGEIGNRLLTLAWGTDGNQVVSDTVENWRNVAPCGN